MKRATFYVCKRCGNIVIKVNDGGGTLMCCGQPMEILEPNSTDAAQEKHVPAIEIDGDTLKVSVGSVLHPMDPDHYIEWVYVVTKEGVLARCFQPGEEPVASFDISGQNPISVFAFCNKHGLWKIDL
ncbi:MAG: desulfoferrodoxin family protein [Coriobacteriales bacterium]